MKFLSYVTTDLILAPIRFEINRLDNYFRSECEFKCVSSCTMFFIQPFLKTKRHPFGFLGEGRFVTTVYARKARIHMRFLLRKNSTANDASRLIVQNSRKREFYGVTQTSFSAKIKRRTIVLRFVFGGRWIRDHSVCSPSSHPQEIFALQKSPRRSSCNHTQKIKTKRCLVFIFLGEGGFGPPK